MMLKIRLTVYSCDSEVLIPIQCNMVSLINLLGRNRMM